MLFMCPSLPPHSPSPLCLICATGCSSIHRRDKNSAVFPKSDPALTPGLVVPTSEINIVSWEYYTLDAFTILFLSPLYGSI